MIKSIFDFLFAILIIIGLLPFWLIIIIVPFFSIFKQTRIGQYGKPFTIYKIRTMHKGKVTRIGKFLRKFKIDELPQLFNILKGDMSFVGPRPDIPGYYDKLEGKDRDVLKLKPGLTSLAALKYANEEILLLNENDPKSYNDTIIFPNKVQMNLAYCKKASFRYDLYIIGLTLKAIFVKNKITL
ncbi:sugar transferase [Dokdonia sp. 4H-3-7-5]|uniref:sugar transferase n=1 Tax=Dokdonia sp. (strain 4H-3-7-5) TaxID=983548 RepID=UPI00020A6C1E|nr:sugar transferase [Dokdonia sp. 4H-3-7-5]AEE20735.1 sugar transferase [Dokdonia sp. 4H-3-7-5]